MWIKSTHECATHASATQSSPTQSCASIHELNKVPAGQSIVDIGPKTIELFREKINNAATIFANGTMGIYEKSDYEIGSKKILEAIAQSDAFSVIGGGDAVAATQKFGYDDRMSFLSTGGGATLAYLASSNPEEDLPGLAAMRLQR